MKKFVLLFLTTICLSFAGCNQRTNTHTQQPCITFLGIPVDGTPDELFSKLDAKGYKYDSYNDCIVGEFNGMDVLIGVQTVNNKVWRIAVVDKSYSDESDIKIRFNNLFEQFLNNSKYVCIGGNIINENEHIYIEMLYNNKRYEATFRPVDESINGRVWYTIGEMYGGYVIVMFYENLNNAADGSEL